MILKDVIWNIVHQVEDYTSILRPMDFTMTRQNTIYNQKIGVEDYVSGVTNHFMTVTGNVYCDGELLEKRDVLQSILDKYMLHPKPKKGIEMTKSKSYLSDESGIEEASTSVNAERFRILWKGDMKVYASHSVAYLALCNILAFWCGRDIK
jgi:putative DNA primase/helicase